MKNSTLPLILTIACCLGLFSKMYAQVYGSGSIPGTYQFSGVNYADDTRAHVSGSSLYSITIGLPTGPMVPGDKVLIIQMSDCGTTGPNWEFQTINSIGLNTLSFSQPLHYDNINGQGIYTDAQVIKVTQYTNVRFDPGAVLTCHPWDPATRTGGVLPLMVKDTLWLSTTEVNIDASYTGVEAGNAGIGGAPGGAGGAGGTAVHIDGFVYANHLHGGGGQGIGGAGWGADKGYPGTPGGGYSNPSILCGFAMPNAKNVSVFNSNTKRLLLGSSGASGSGGQGGYGAGGSGFEAYCPPLSGPPYSNPGQAGGAGGTGALGGRGGGLIILQARKIFSVGNVLPLAGTPIMSKGEDGADAHNAATTGGATGGGQGGDAIPGYGAGGGNGGNGGNGGAGGGGGAGGRLHIVASNFAELDPLPAKVFRNLQGGNGGSGGSGGAAGPKGNNADLTVPNCPILPYGEYYCACDTVWQMMNGALCTNTSVPFIYSYVNSGWLNGLGVSCLLRSDPSGNFSMVCTDGNNNAFYCHMEQEYGTISDPINKINDLCSSNGGPITLDPDYGACQLTDGYKTYINHCCDTVPIPYRYEPIPGFPGLPGPPGEPGDEGDDSGEAVEEKRIGEGIANSTNGSNIGPIFRLSATSATDYSQHYYLFTASELATAGILPGALITQIAWNKSNTSGTSASNTVSIWKVYMKNSNTFPSPTWCNSNFNTQASGASLVYNNTAQIIPSSAGFITLNLPAPFVYSGGSLEIGSSWNCSLFGGNPTTGGFQWKQDPLSNHVFGGSGNTSSISMTSQTSRPQIQLTISGNAFCSGMPNPGNTTAIANILCQGETVTLGLQNAGTSGASYTYQWYDNAGAIAGATSMTYVANLTSSTTFHCNVTCSGLTASSAPISITVNPTPTVSTTTTTSTLCSGSSVTINGFGASVYSWQPDGLSGNAITVSPTVTTTYTVTGTNSYGCTSSATRTIDVITCGSTVNLNLFLQGYYIGAGLMAPVLMNQGVLGSTSELTDTITVELRNSMFTYIVAQSLTTILNTDGTATCNFNVAGSYYIVVKHRNAIETWSALPITLGAGTVSYDFSTSAIQAYGGNETEVEPGIFAIYSGDLNQDENIDLLDIATLEYDINNFSFGYFATDLNGDGNVDLLDTPILENNINNFVFSVHP